MKKTMIIAAVAAGLAFSASVSNAQVVIDSTSSPLIQTGVGAGANDGTIYTWVIAGLGSGLTFVYQVVNTGPDATDLVTINTVPASLYVSSTTATSFDTLNDGPIGTVVTGGPMASLGDSGGVVNFYGAGAIGVGDESDFLIVNTTATTYGTGYSQELDNFTAQGNVYIPTAVPEASTVMAGMLMLLPLGIGAVRAVRKERAV